MATGDKTIIANKAYVDTVVSNIDLSTKQDVLVNGINIKTINGQSVLGSGDFELQAGATVVETVIAPNETKTVYTNNTKIVGGLNVSIMEEDISTVETVGVFEPTYGNVDGIDSKNYALADTLTISATTAILGTSTWDVDSVNKTIYEKGGRGIASIISIDGSTAIIKIVSPFSKNILNSGDWFMYSFLLNSNGDITLSKGSSAEYIENIKYANVFQPSASTAKSNIMTQVDNLGTTHVCFLGTVDGFTSLCYGRLINDMYIEEVNILNSNLYSTAITSDNFYMLVDSNRTVHIAFSYTKQGQTDRKLVYGYKTENGEWTEVPEINQLSLTTTDYPILNETTTGNVDIITKEGSILKFYRKTGGVWNKSAISQWDSNLIKSNERNALYILNLPAGAFEIYSGIYTNIYCCGYNGVTLFYKGTINITTDYKNIGFIVEQDGVHRNLICGLQKWISSSSWNMETYVMRFNSSNIGDFTKNTVSISGIGSPAEQIDRVDNTGTTTINKLNFYKDKITDNIYILFLYTGCKSRALIKRVDSVWYTFSNKNSILYSAPFSTIEGRLHYISGYGICELPLNGNSFINDLSELKPPFYTPIIKNNSTYNTNPLNTMFLRIDNEGYMHGVFEQGTKSYASNYIPCYITNRTETGEFIIDYNFSNQSLSAATQRVSGLTVDANGVPYVLFAGWAAKCIWKKVNGVWDGNYSAGSAINIAPYSLQRDEGHLFRVEHINGDEYIYINGYMLANSNYYPCEYKLVNRIMSTTVLDNMFTGVIGSSFNPQKMLWYTSKSNVTVFMPMQGQMDVSGGVNIHKDGVKSSYTITSRSSKNTFHGNSNPNFVTEDEDGNIIILFVMSDPNPSTNNYTVLHLLIINSNGNIVFNNYLNSFYPGNILSYSYSIEEKRVYIFGSSSVSDRPSDGATWSIFYVDIAKALNSTSITSTPTPYTIYTIQNNFANSIVYNNVKKGVDGFIPDPSLINSHIVHMTSKKSSETYINNEYVHVHLPAIYTKYWYEISAKSVDYVTNGQSIDMSFSYDGNTYSVYKIGQTDNRKIVSNISSITGLVDGVWCYNNNTDYTLETWIEATDKNEAFTLAKGIETNRMFNSDLIFSELSVNDLLYFSVSLFSNNSGYSPRFKNLKLFYLSLARWVNRTQNYEIYAQGVDAISVKSLDNETKHIKVVHNG